MKENYEGIFEEIFIEAMLRYKKIMALKKYAENE